jgi:hypothetical protein
MREATAKKGPPIDLTEFERRLRGPQPQKASGNDPLKELARLLQGNDAQAPADPYRDVFAEETPYQGSSERPPEPSAGAPQPPHYDQSEAYYGDLRGSYDDVAATAPSDAAPAHQQYYEADHQEAAYYDQSGYDQNADWSLDENQAYLDYGGQYEGDYSGQDEAGSKRRFPKFRPWHVAAGIVALGVASIGWTFAHRSGGSIAPQEVAIIAAPAGPARVPPAANEAPQAEQGLAVLDRSESAAVKTVVTSEEQPVDPAAEPKALRLGAGPVDAPHLAGDGLIPMPEPRKVKTVSIRPDGTVIPNDAVPPAVVAKPPRPAPPPVQVSPEETEVQGGTPKIAAKPATTPRAVKPAPKPIAAKPARKPAQVAVAEPPAVNDNAAPAETPAPSPSAGSFAVQFGAAGSVDEARGMMTSVVSKYGSHLGGRRLSYHRAKVGDKTVYRVRARGMSKDSAVAICEKVKAAGGNCFVAAGG